MDPYATDFLPSTLPGERLCRMNGGAAQRRERTNRWPNFRVKGSATAIYHLQFEPASLGKGQRSAAVRNPLSFYTSAILDAEETGLISKDLLTFSPGKKKLLSS